MKRAVIDTSVLLRYLIRPSVSIRELIEARWLTGDVQMVTSPELLDELEAVLQRESIRAFVQPEDARALLDAIYRTAEILPPLGSVPAYTRDPKDDKFVACALAAGTSFVVTVDQDLLALGSLAGVRALTPRDFLSALEQD